MVSHSIPPEYRRIAGVVDYFLMSTEIQVNAELSKDVATTGNIQIVYRSFNARDIPGGEDWRWNQTKARQTLQLPHTKEKAIIFKLIPRLRKKGAADKRLPKFKLWQLRIFPKFTIPFWVLYCEKGNESNLLIEDYSFLYKFMEEKSVAQSLWPEIH